MLEQDLIKKIISKKEFSELPIFDVKMALSKFDSKKYLDEEKIKLTRDLLRKAYSVFLSRKIFNAKNKDFRWFLKKHISTKERLNNYNLLYSKILKRIEKPIEIYDLGCGVNGFSYPFLLKESKNISYFGIEAIKQLVDLQKNYFKENSFKGDFYHESLYNLQKIKKIIPFNVSVKIVFLFKVLDSLEMFERDYSKKLLKEIVPLVDFVVISFATKSLVSRKNFRVSREWLFSFIKNNFKILEDYELDSERYIVFKKR